MEVYGMFNMCVCVFYYRQAACRDPAEGMCEQSYWNPLEDPPPIPLDDPSDTPLTLRITPSAAAHASTQEKSSTSYSK